MRDLQTALHLIAVLYLVAAHLMLRLEVVSERHGDIGVAFAVELIVEDGRHLPAPVAHGMEDVVDRYAQRERVVEELAAVGGTEVPVGARRVVAAEPARLVSGSQLEGAHILKGHIVLPVQIALPEMLVVVAHGHAGVAILSCHVHGQPGQHLPVEVVAGPYLGLRAEVARHLVGLAADGLEVIGNGVVFVVVDERERVVAVGGLQLQEVGE
jgi:hypothetical protein